MTFAEIAVRPELVAALAKQQITEPTAIQVAALPALLAGKDAYLNAETGTGKTMAYLLPIFTRIGAQVEATQVVIVAPTHELAIQIQRQCTDLAQNAGWPIRTLLLIGGTAIDRQIDKLKKKPQVVVGSPGRIADLIAMVALATVFRRTVDRPWTSLGAVAADGRGRMEFVDTAVQGGNRYGYGLGVDAGDANQIVATSWVDVPHTAQFALRGARPNPSSRGLSVEFSLPDAVPARIELFDLAGRRLAQHDVGPLGAGTHTMRLDPRQGLASGVYHIRLTRQGRSLTDRAVVVQQ